MKPNVCQLSLVLLAAAASPCALAGPDILKCVDSSGHVTLTDQPCPAGSRVTLVIPDAGPAARPAERGTTQVGGSGAAGATGSGGEETTAPAPAAERLPAPPPPPPRGRYKPPSKPTPLSRDEATLKAARLKMTINDDQMARQAAQ